MTIADRPFESARSSTESTQVSRYRSARRRRVQVVLLTFGLFAATLAAIIALRAAISLQAFHH